MAKKPKLCICPTCRQDMNEPPHEGLNGKTCSQCGQGLSWRKVRAKKPKTDVWGWGVEWEEFSGGAWYGNRDVWDTKPEAQQVVHYRKTCPAYYRNVRGPVQLVKRKEAT